ncbi:MAG: 16S rRNA (cytidine(1402)-2'-O)-methyltransferase [Pseudomonadota bacterium]
MGTDANAIQPGVLYVVATPIGNLEDITYRAVKILGGVDVIAAEDTRHTAKLLARYAIRRPLVSCHEHNEDEKISEFIDRLKGGASMALVSDAGTPSVSDPGFKLVKACIENAVLVLPVPGPSAAIAGLSVSGLPTDAFRFSGFPSRKSGKRKLDLQQLASDTCTHIFYESPRRITALVEETLEVLGDRQAMLAREITKIHEEYLRGSLSEILDVLKARDTIKGECTLIVSGEAPAREPDGALESDLDQAILSALADKTLGTSGLAKVLARQFNLPRKAVYDRILALRKS